ncbi:5'-nucleotidase C-terminal domain-containing protein [Methylophilus medardicus]|uniref:Type I secretion C-terminal target domain-containing protein n=1 Tax=Methylophilus medardicus TaxID=2588534 RepID=A0A5B8CTQ0_9PROT|nr:5'-nucleotidase C-terminal domain-containing protein [Methylophilus medardicus]QDC44682.1 type I secretion C-terminal target domain-containing protein [Methylophilus medardicus]QDC49689.1 type I secretion C-terminal target domain-containing protein [Methylophilus medardicus]QDC53394.1 type I secretion C-terminal target domain-containing protein [Methylophilus medardicus]
MFKLKQLTACVALALTAGVAWAEGVTVLHVGDQESWLLSAQGNLRDNAGQPISFYGGIDRLATVMKNAEMVADSAGRTVLKLNAGDAFLPGPRFKASLDNLGNAYMGGQDFYDAIALRQIGFDALVVGNHEFDLGPEIAARFAEVSGSTYLSVNLNFDATTAFASLKSAGKVAPSKIVTTKAGHKIGLVGATTPLLPNISSPGAVNLFAYDPFNTEAQNLQALIPLIQAEVNRLRTDEGVKTVILMSHLQNSINEINVVVPALQGVDLVLSGGGHELMVDADDALINGGVAATYNSHPVIATDANGKSVPVLTSHFGNRYVGQVNFSIDDDQGTFAGIESTKMMRVSGASADADRVTGNVALQAQVVTPVSDYITALNAQIIGTTAVKLNGPTHTSCTPAPCTFVAGVRNAETGLGNLVADAMRFAGKSDVAIQNGGGIRTSIAAAGNVSVGDTFNILPFTNLVKRAPEMNASQLKDILEHSVINANATGGNNGRFAQVSGMQVVYDTRQTPRASTTATDPAPVGTGNRVRRVVLDDGTVLIDNGVVVNNSRTFSFTTIDFTAAGGDGYPFPANSVQFENDPFTITYQEALANYIQTPKSEGGLGRLNNADGDEVTVNMYGLENQYDRGGRLIDLAIANSTPGVTRNGTAARDTLIGTAGDDVINGGLGVDTLTGGAGNDVFVFNSMREAGDTITDFTPYADKLQLTALLSSLGISSNSALTGGFLRLVDVTAGVQVMLDSDGSAGPAAAKPLVTLKGLTAKQVAPARDFIL